MDPPPYDKDAATSKVRPSDLNRKSSIHDADIQRLAEMGYTQDMTRKFSVWSVLAVGFSLTNSWFGVSAALVTGLDSGGPVLLVYGIILVFMISLCVGSTLSEMASAMPNAGGQYFWASELAPKRWANFASYLTGWFSWAGSIFTSASVALAMGCIEIKTWHIFVSYQLINLVIFVFNCYGKILPTIATATFYISITSFIVILITVPSVAPEHQSARFVFATFINNTGWSSSGIAFIVGLINTSWPFACLDCATHLSEEVPEPERMIPKAIMGTVGIGFVTAWFYVVAMFFSINGPFEDIRDSATLVPILELFYKALNHRAGAIVLESLIILTGMGCLNASHTWQSRLCWSFARDNGLPFSSWLSKVNHTLDVPLYAHAFSCTIVAAVGCLFLGSYTAFNSMVTACIVLLFISYTVPTICLLIRGRNNIAHGPFWLGTFGHIANYVLLAWTLFTLIMFSFPVRMPVRADNMNYVSAVYFAVILIMTIDWFVRGRREYRQKSVQTRRQSIRRESFVRGESFGGIPAADGDAAALQGRRGTRGYGSFAGDSEV